MSTTLTSSDALIANAAFAVALSVLYYDHALTFGDELQYFWRWPIFRGNFFFLVNRYFSFFSHLVLLAVRYFHSPGSPCGYWQLLNQITLITTQMLVMAILMLRTYALYNRSRRIAALLIAATLIGSGICTVEFVKGRHTAGSTTSAGANGCIAPIPDDKVTSFAVGWIVQFGIDSLVVILTLLRTWQFPRHGDKLPQVIRRDGVVYFGLIAAVNLVNIATFYTLPPLTRGCLGTFASCISVTLVSRLSINLQRPTETSYLTSGPVDIVEDGSIFESHATWSDSMAMQGVKTWVSDDVEQNTCYGTEDGLLSAFPSPRRY